VPKSGKPDFGARRAHRLRRWWARREKPAHTTEAVPGVFAHPTVSPDLRI
jgi:hypothetical protein